MLTSEFCIAPPFSIVGLVATDAEALADFLLAEPWPFHAGSGLTREVVLRRVAEGFYTGTDNRTFWIHGDDGGRIGYLRVFDLGGADDPGAPLFDIRVAAVHRGRGAAREAVRWLVGMIFTSYPAKSRIEATTREDNIAMRRVLRRCGFVKEAHYRRAWRVDGASALDALGYGILRSDWEEGITTPVRWDDEP
jgi:RimJ/RimL family protein N-acetyltransferase